MKRYTMFIMGCMLALLSMAQQPDAKALLDEATNKLRQNQGIQAAFVISSEQIEANVTLYMDNNRFVIAMEGMKIWFDGETQWTYMDNTQEVTVSNPTPEELVLLNPYSLLESYQTGYDISLMGNYQSKTFYEVRMKAQTEAQPYQQVSVMLNKRTMHPIRIKYKTQGINEEAVVMITEYHTKKQYTDDFFQFNPAEYPQAEVIDLR